MTPDIHPLIIFIASILTSNILLSNFLGMCSFVAVSKTIDTAFGLGMAVTFVSTVTAAINWILYHYFIRPGALTWLLGEAGASLDLSFLYFIVAIAVIAAFVQIVEIVVEKASPSLYYSLGIFLPLITVNCSILGISLFFVVRQYRLLQTVAFGFGSGAGFLLAIVLMAGIRQKLRFSNIPTPLQGVGITLFATGVMAMVFMGFAGMVPVK